MHQILFPFGLRPRPRWESLQRSPDSLAVFKGPTSNGMEGIGGREGKGEGEGRVAPQLQSLDPPVIRRDMLRYTAVLHETKPKINEKKNKKKI